MDWTTWIKFSLLIALAGGFMAWATSVSRTLREHGLKSEEESAKKEGIFMFKLLLVAASVAALAGFANQLLGYPFT